jgi:uncharacterized protein (DUF2141 family)
VTIALSAGPTSKPNTTTDSSGNYSFTGLAGGTYTVTPSLAGYTFTPSAPNVVTSASTTTQNFTEASTLSSFTISGTLTYAGSKAGRTYIRVYNSNNCNGNGCAVAGTSLASAPTSGGTSFTVHGLQNGSYVVVAEVDTLNSGVPNASNPSGSSSTVTINSSNATGAIVTLTDPATPTPVAIQDMSIAPGSNFALIMYDQNSGGGSLQDNNGRELATSYEIDYDTHSNFSTQTVVTFTAKGTNDRNYIAHNLTPGASYYFRMYSIVGSTKSAAFTTSTPVTLAPPAGAFTVSGTVTFPVSVTATGPLYVGLFNGNVIYGKEIPTPYSSGVAFSITGVPAGNYQIFAIMDQNNNGLIDPSDVTNVNNNQGGPPPITVSGNTSGNTLPLTSAVSTINLTTNHQQFNGSNDSYNLNFNMSWGSKRPVAMTLLSGSNVPLPWDMPVDQNNGMNAGLPNGQVPHVGDAYQFQVTFSDGTTQTIPESVTAVLNSFVTNMQINTPVNSSSGTPVTVPMFNWVTPASTPNPYTYFINLNTASGSTNVNWNDYGGHNSNGIASGTTNVQFNADSSANVWALPTGQTYNWFVGVQDSQGNSSQEGTAYVIP